MKDSTRRQINQEGHDQEYFTFSPSGRYLIYYDLDTAAYFAYDVSNGKVNNISNKIPTRVSNENSAGNDNDAVDAIPGWVEGGKGVFI